jgi:hypothetical protein
VEDDERARAFLQQALRCEAVPHAFRSNEPFGRESAMTGSDMIATGQTTSVDGSER